jgi:hypothetical protein
MSTILSQLSSIQIALFLCRNVFPSVVCQDLPFYFFIIYKRQDFLKKTRTLNLCLNFVYKFCLKYFSF